MSNCVTSILLAIFAILYFTNASSISKIDSQLIHSFQSKPLANIFVTMREGTEGVLSQIPLNNFDNVGDRATAVYNALTAHSKESQKSVLEILNSNHHPSSQIKSFWITNQIYIQDASDSLVHLLASMEEVSAITKEEIVIIEDTSEIEPEMQVPKQEGIFAEWGIEKIKAQEAWAVGGNGNGVVVGVIDSGARYTHETIRSSYRGGTHSWYNPYDRTQNPHDGHGHGTHVTGTIVGTNGIGVAPGAKWISCKGLKDDNSGTSSALITCGEFMTCPHTYNGGSPDCTKAPHVVSNSWGTATGGATWFDGVLRAWHAAGIIPVFAAMNTGPNCNTVCSPADSQVGAIGVGATTSTDAIASFSSRGPTNRGVLKPDVSAPGSSVRSAGISSDSAYTNMSGTSMGTPHVAGLVCLLKSQNLNANYATIKNILQNTTDRNLVSNGASCSGVPDNTFPNHHFGYGRINALKAVQAITQV